MKLIGTKSEIDDLKFQGLLVINSDDPFEALLSLKPGLDSKPRQINVELLKEEVNSIKLKECDFIKIKNSFPTLNDFGKLQPNSPEEDRRNLRSGKDDAAKRSIIKLLDRYTVEEIANGINFEIEFRVKNNNLKYMTSFAAWLNNTSNVEVMIDSAKKTATLNIVKTKDKMI